MKNKKLVIDLNAYDYTGTSNDIYGMEVKVNGIVMPYDNMDRDVDTILEQILTHLGYKVEINRTYNGE